MRERAKSTSTQLRERITLGQCPFWALPWLIAMLVVVGFGIGFANESSGGGSLEVDSRKVDELILIDVSGSMVRDIRARLLALKLARGETDNDRFSLAPKVTIEAALTRPEMQSVVTNNLLYKTLLCIEAIIDQPGVRTIYLGTFDRGLRRLVPKKLPGELREGLYGPFVVAKRDVDLNSSGRSAIKTFLVADQPGRGAGSGWRGVLAETVLKGSGPTALYDTAGESLDFLAQLVEPDYTNSTRAQRLFLFTDGQEEMPPKRPFTATVERLGKHFSFLDTNGVAFEFTKYYIGDTPVDAFPATKPPYMKIGKVSPRTFHVAAGVNEALSGELKLPKKSSQTVTVKLSPPVRFRVWAKDDRPVSGRLVLGVVGQEVLSGLSAQATPIHIPTSGTEQAVEVSLALQGTFLDELARTGIKSLNKLQLNWELLPTPDLVGDAECKVDFFGDTRWPISLRISPPVEEVEVRCIEPVGLDVSSRKKLELRASPRGTALATFQADFSKVDDGGSLAIELQAKPESSWLRLNPGNGSSVTLVKEATNSANLKFFLLAQAPPGAGRVDFTLKIVPQSPWLTPTPSNIEGTVTFEPSVIGTTWFTHDGQPTAPPNAIEFGTNFMEPTTDPGGEVRSKQPPVVDTVGFAIPALAVTPTAEWVLTGEHPEAFAIMPLGDGGGSPSKVINRSLKLQVRARHFFVQSKRLVTTNLTAVLEIRPLANFVFGQREGGTAAQGESKIVVPLRMTAVIPPPPETLKPSN